jgi:hypothetical protein
VEALEGRAVPATFGLPWGDARHLSLSFVPDGTAIAGHASDLFQMLDSRQATDAWQRTVLRAFQTWAVRSNVNIGLRADGGQAIGTPGKNQHDARFGDIRVAAHAMAPDALAISVPGGSLLAGTWSGDMFLNSDVFRDATAPDLFSVALHEAGHVFGLDNSTDPSSPLYSHLTGAVAPTEADTEMIQSLYGARVPDRYEGPGGNDTTAQAASFPVPDDYSIERPLVLFADRTSETDVDVFELTPPGGYTGAMTVRLQSAGLSLLAPRLTVLDAARNVLGEVFTDSSFGDIVTIRLPEVTPGQSYYLQVDSLNEDVFSIGSYGLAVSFDAALAVEPAVLDRVLGGDFGTPGPDEVVTILRHADRGFFNDDWHTDDEADEAVKLETTPGYAPRSHYEAIGSLTDAADVDFYRVRSLKKFPDDVGVMTVTVRSLDDQGTAPSVSILDEDLDPVSFRILRNGDGVYTIEADGVEDNDWYYLQLPAGDSSEDQAGNYELAVDFSLTTAELATFAEGSTGPSASDGAYDVFIARSQLFHLLLAAGPSETPGSAVRMTVTDANGSALYTLASKAGKTTGGGTLFLTPGAYRIHLVAEGTDQPLDYVLMGQSISDPIGPAVVDPTLQPIYTLPGAPPQPPIYAYPGGIITPIPYIIVDIVMEEPPPAPVPPPPPAPAPPPTFAPSGPPGPASVGRVRAAVAPLTRSGRTSLSIGFEEPPDPGAASNAALYVVLGGVRRRGRIVFSKPLRVLSVQFDGLAQTATVTLAQPFKGPLQVTAPVGIVAEDGRTGVAVFASINPAIAP